MSTRKWLSPLGLALAMVFPGTGAPSAQAETPQRYPYDPVCQWGRLADGHGMMIRCLEPKEASWLLQGKKPQASAPKKLPKTPAAESKPAQIRVTAVGPTTADTGELPLADKKLGQAKERFAQCAERHGGLTQSRAKVVVRFLVRERGRAEGVSVKSRKGLSAKAAQCIADVVDRRYVGYPAAPIVGATIPIELDGSH